jgi:putative FmdB family regulatory protein
VEVSIESWGDIMPTYEYVCRDCARHLEVVQSFRDAPLVTCGACGGPLRKVFSAAGIIFKGSGYYITDSRAKKPAESSDTKESSSAKEPSSAKESSGQQESSGTKPKDGASSSGTSTAESA